jgi:hypothetical protein
MKRMSTPLGRTPRRLTPLGLSISGALVAAAVSALAISASAQTPTTSSAGVLSTAPAAPKKPTTATPDMVNEAIQRSQARADRERLNGTAQKWGSEEPFTYNPAVKNFTASHQ